MVNNKKTSDWSDVRVFIEDQNLHTQAAQPILVVLLLSVVLYKLNHDQIL